MKQIPIILLLLFICSCDEDSSYDPTINFETISNLYAPVEGGQGQTNSGSFTKFDFETGSTICQESSPPLSRAEGWCLSGPDFSS